MAENKCVTSHCRNSRDRGRFCFGCITRKSRARDVVKACYYILRSNAIRRHKEFTLTIDQFRKFCKKTDYIAGKGRTCESYSIDREKNHIGYTMDNIRVLSVSENSKKGTKILHYDYQTRYATVTQKTPYVYQLDNPF